MPIRPNYDANGVWLPKSDLFKWVMSLGWRKRMVQEQPKEHGACLAFCTSCGAAYLLSDERPHSPCHATDPILTFDFLTLIDGFNVLAELLEAGRGALSSQELSQEPASTTTALPSADAGSTSEDGGSAPPFDRSARRRRPRKPSPAPEPAPAPS